MNGDLPADLYSEQKASRHFRFVWGGLGRRHLACSGGQLAAQPATTPCRWVSWHTGSWNGMPTASLMARHADRFHGTHLLQYARTVDRPIPAGAIRPRTADAADACAGGELGEQLREGGVE